jgi:hypothetical protein
MTGMLLINLTGMVLIAAAIVSLLAWAIVSQRRHELKPAAVAVPRAAEHRSTVRARRPRADASGVGLGDLSPIG